MGTPTDEDLAVVRSVALPGECLEETIARLVVERGGLAATIKDAYATGKAAGAADERERLLMLVEAAYVGGGLVPFRDAVLRILAPPSRCRCGHDPCECE